MIAIEENIIYRDSEKIGQIVGTVAWMNAKQAGRIIGQIKQAANIEGLTFEIVDTPEEKANLEALSVAEESSDTPTDKEYLTVETLSAPEVVDNPPASEPAVSCDDLAAGTFQGFKVIKSIQAEGAMLDKMKRAQVLISASPDFDIPADFGSYEENPKHFAQCFINTYGPHGYDAWLKRNGL